MPVCLNVHGITATTKQAHIASLMLYGSYDEVLGILAFGFGLLLRIRTLLAHSPDVQAEVPHLQTCLLLKSWFVTKPRCVQQELSVCCRLKL